MNPTAPKVIAEITQANNIFLPPARLHYGRANALVDHLGYKVLVRNS